MLGPAEVSGSSQLPHISVPMDFAFSGLLWSRYLAQFSFPKCSWSGSAAAEVPGLGLFQKNLWLQSTPLEVSNVCVSGPAEDLAQAYALCGPRLTLGPVEASGSCQKYFLGDRFSFR